MSRSEKELVMFKESSAQLGMVLGSCLIFLSIIFLLTLGAMQSNILNQKMEASFQAQAITLAGAEAGLIAEQLRINGQSFDLSAISATVDYGISAQSTDNCGQQIFTIYATAAYQNARTQLKAVYLKARDPPLPGCVANQDSHQLWWQQLDP